MQSYARDGPESPGLRMGVPMNAGASSKRHRIPSGASTVSAVPPNTRQRGAVTRFSARDICGLAVSGQEWRSICGQTLPASEPDDVIHGLAGELRLALGHKEPGQIVFAGGEVGLMVRSSSPAMGCSTLRLCLSRATQGRDRLTSSRSRRIPMASETRRTCR